jgi:hypothetical protein
MTEVPIVVCAVLGWLALALLGVAVVACAGRAGHGEDLRRGYVPASSAPAQPASRVTSRPRPRARQGRPDHSCVTAPTGTQAPAVEPSCSQTAQT